MSPGITGIQLIGDDARAAGKDFEVLYKLSRLAYVDRVGESRSAHPVAQREWRCRRESNGSSSDAPATVATRRVCRGE